MAEPLKNVGTPIAGIRELSDLTSVSGSARRFSTKITINPGAVLDELQNNGVPVHQVKGDGRVWFDVLSSAPSSPVVGDVWVENDGTLGTVLRLRAASGTVTFSAAALGNLSIVAAAALLKGHAVRATGSGLAYAAAAAGQFHLIGILAADVAMGDAGQILPNGKALQMADWSLLTGSATLTVGTSYWLSTTPGRYTSTVPTSIVAARVGRAVATDTLLVDAGLTVVM